MSDQTAWTKQPLPIGTARQMLQDQFGIGHFHAATMLEFMIERGVLRLTGSSIAENDGAKRWFNDTIDPKMLTDGVPDFESETLLLPTATIFGLATTFGDFYRVWPAEADVRRGVGGRSLAADWPEYEKALRAEIALVGLPTKAGTAGWRTQADVCRWIEGRLADDENPSPTTIKDNVRSMLSSIKAEKDEN